MANQQIWLFLSSILLLSSADGHFLPGNYLLWSSLLDYILETFPFGQITLVAMLIIGYIGLLVGLQVTKPIMKLFL